MTWRVEQGDCIRVLRTLPADSIDAVVTDPPYGLGFMGKAWDALPPGQDWAEECLRVLKPGGVLLAFGGTRTYHRLAVALEDAGFEIRDMIAWLYGSGFPKSKTVLKPAHEPIVLARKPLVGTVAANVAAHGTGALNIDASRIGSGEGGARSGEASAERRYAKRGSTNFAPTPGPRGGDERGRWPANVVMDPEAGALLDAQTGTLTSGREAQGGHRRSADKFRTAYGDFAGTEIEEGVLYGDSGGASRFFYCAKASRRERDAGLESFAEVETGKMEDDSYQWATDGRGNPRSGKTRARNDHPTVKPIALMRWLVRLVTPTGGTVLDPFTGSGTTGCAAVLEGFDFVGVEREPHYLALATARITRWASQVSDGGQLRLGDVA